jgi:hypothetical protein
VSAAHAVATTLGAVVGLAVVLAIYTLLAGPPPADTPAPAPGPVPTVTAIPA